jgi:hypothetical protein
MNLSISKDGVSGAISVEVFNKFDKMSGSVFMPY